MKTIPEIIEEVRSGVVRLAFYRGSEQVGNGSGFLCHNLLITNSHVIRTGTFDAAELTFGDQRLAQLCPSDWPLTIFFTASRTSHRNFLSTML